MDESQGLDFTLLGYSKYRDIHPGINSRACADHQARRILIENARIMTYIFVIVTRLDLHFKKNLVDHLKKTVFMPEHPCLPDYLIVKIISTVCGIHLFDKNTVTIRKLLDKIFVIISRTYDHNSDIRES